MNQDWQNFLATQGLATQGGAHVENRVVSHFGAAAAERVTTRDGTVLCDLSQFRTLRVCGADAQSFLQNLLSNDITEVSSTHAQLSSLNNAKGRMLATLLIWRDGADYLLHLPHTLNDAIRKKLGMYVLRAKVKISDDEIISLGLSGKNSSDILSKQFGELPHELPQMALGCIHHAPTTIIKISDTRFQIHTPAAHAPALWTALRHHAQPVGSACWDWLNIRSGIPSILPQTQEQFVAQMVNFDLINGVSFKKGCYPGQEIVARTQYLGKLKRRMFLAHMDSNEIPQPGDELFSADMEGQASGMLVNTAAAPSGGYDVLAVVQTTSRESQTVHWKSLQGAALQFLPLPYSLPQN